MRKDVADLFAIEGEGTRGTLAHLKDRAVDALDLALSEAPEGGSARERYRYAKESVLPLLTKIEDPGERSAALTDVTETLKLGVRDLRETIAAMAQQEERPKEGEGGDAEEPGPGPLSEEARELIAHPGVLKRYVEDVARIHGVVKDRGILRLQVLVATGAQLEPLPNGRPAGANLMLTAEAGRGKNYVCDAAAAALPEGWCLPFESASAKSLFYRDPPTRGPPGAPDPEVEEDAPGKPRGKKKREARADAPSGEG